ncbi:MAG: lysylphosphatidylglycerol synthase transmembrane domain-containing protein [Verrucomicrobia bacterium]|nr:lysylphosphatidylglycerol synthase transmembrane domain-containing protein [Verrucomicrobiota bacterium]
MNKQRLATFLQLLLGLGLLAYIFHRLDQQGELASLRQAFHDAAGHGLLLLLGASATGVCLCIGTLRWFLVLRAQGFALSIRQVVELYFIGQFFNVFLLGATGGDVVKAVLVARESHQQKTEIVTSIFIDRLIGLMTLVVLAPLAMLFRRDLFWDRPESRALLLLAIGILLCAVLGIWLIFGQHILERVPFLKRWTDATPAGRIIARVYGVFHFVLRHPGLLVRTLALSALNHLTAVGGAVAFGVALGLPLTALDYLACFFAVNLIAAVPVTPSGIGTRETVTLALLGAMGVAAAQAVSLSLMLYGAILLWGLIGGAVYAAYLLRSRPH